MKSLLSLGLGAAVLLAATSLPLPAADIPTLALRPVETAEQRAARHAAEHTEAEARINALVKQFPLLTDPAREENLGKFRAELKRVQSFPEFRRRPLLPPRPITGQPPQPMTAERMHLEQRAATLTLMRQQADKVLVKHPELKGYLEQQFQWHRRLFEVQDRYPGNPQVRQLVQNRLEVVAVPVAAQP